MFSIRGSFLIAGSLSWLAACGGPSAGPQAGDPSAARNDAAASTTDGAGAETFEPLQATAPRVPELGATPRFATVATSRNGLRTPRDLAFNPNPPRSASGGNLWQLWTVNQANDSAVIITLDPEQGTGSSEVRIDANADHFMEDVSSIAFGARDTFATCQESENTYNHEAHPNNFMGPTLWSSDLSIFAVDDPSFGPLGSHLDMLHESPNCMGIAHDRANVYFVFDGHHGHVVQFDFQRDHGPGHDDHSDGRVRRFVDAEVHYVPGVPGHMEFDHETGWLYVADPGAGRVIRLDTASGQDTVLHSPYEEQRAGAPMRMEPLAYYALVTGARVETFSSTALTRPSGLAIANGRLFVGDNATSEIVVFDLATGEELSRVTTPAESLMGITLGPDGHLWYVDAAKSELVRVEP